MVEAGQESCFAAQHSQHQSIAFKPWHVVQETPSNPSLDELHAEDVKDKEADDRVEDAKKVADCLR